MSNRYLTLAPENEFQFVCPIFNAKTKMAACMVLRERVWMGQPTEKRQGCQAAMNCSMCPAAAIVERIGKRDGTPHSDDYGSTEPKIGKIHAQILERVRNTIPIKAVLDRFTLTANERELLATTRARIDEQLKTAPGRDGRTTSYIAPKKIEASLYPSKSVAKRDRSEDREYDMPAETRPIPRQSAKIHTINKAAMTGDMSAAINAAA